MKDLRIKGMIVEHVHSHGKTKDAVDFLGGPTKPLRLADVQKMRDWLNAWIDEAMVGEMKK